MSAIPHWLTAEPAAKQALLDGASLVTFSGDKLLGGPQCGVIAGSKELVDKCASHPLMRALRPSGHTMLWLQTVLLSYCARTACDDIPFWNMVSQSTESLHSRAQQIVAATNHGQVVPLTSLVGAGSAPGTSLDSFGIELHGDVRQQLRSLPTPVIARTKDGNTFIDLRSVHPSEDALIVTALQLLTQQ